MGVLFKNTFWEEKGHRRKELLQTIPRVVLFGAFWRPSGGQSIAKEDFRKPFFFVHFRVSQKGGVAFGVGAGSGDGAAMGRGARVLEAVLTLPCPPRRRWPAGRCSTPSTTPPTATPPAPPAPLGPAQEAGPPENSRRF